jgi:uncharacterized protein YegJ (DUF2314 family)
MVFPVLFILPLILLSCGEKGPPPLSIDHTLHLEEADRELGRIAENARYTLPIFIRRLQRPMPGERDFRVKIPFPASGGFSREQLWVGDIRFMNGTYYGTVLNTPFYVSGLFRGDLTSFTMDDITDWMYISGEKIMGGPSIKYLLELIPPAERDEEQRRILTMFE